MYGFVSRIASLNRTTGQTMCKSIQYPKKLFIGFMCGILYSSLFNVGRTLLLGHFDLNVFSTGIRNSLIVTKTLNISKKSYQVVEVLRGRIEDEAADGSTSLDEVEVEWAHVEGLKS